MPAAAINDRNPLINILRLGLLDRRRQPVTGYNGGLNYGLNGKDVLRLQRTCRAADNHLRMTQTAEINALAAAVTVAKGRPPAAEGVQRARAYLQNKMNTTAIKPRALHAAVAEMSNLSRQVVVCKTKMPEREAALVFFTLLYATGGVMTDAATAEAWVARMRYLPSAEYRAYLDTCGNEILRDLAAVGVQLGVAAGSVAAVYQAAHLATSGPVVVKQMAVLTAPAWPILCVSAGITAVQIMPKAIGLVGVSADAMQEASAFAQIKFYKDAVLFDCLAQPNAPLLREHHPDWHLTLLDNRSPRQAEVVGYSFFSAAAEVFSNCMEDILCE